MIWHALLHALSLVLAMGWVSNWSVEVLFALLRLTPHLRNAKVLDAAISWNYTSVLNIIFLALATVLVWRFYRTGGPMMLAMMKQNPAQPDQPATTHHSP